MPADAGVRPVLPGLHGRHPGARANALEAQEGGEAGERDAWLPCVKKHPGKTFIGRIEIGFDFLGYHFGPDGLSVVKKTV